MSKAEVGGYADNNKITNYDSALPHSSSTSGDNMTSVSTGGDMEKVMVPVEDMSNLDDSGLKRDLRLRHMVMIAISGTIGTGLFLTSGKTIATAGPMGACKFYGFCVCVCFRSLWHR